MLEDIYERYAECTVRSGHYYTYFKNKVNIPKWLSKGNINKEESEESESESDLSEIEGERKEIKTTKDWEEIKK